jgi:hypothetical protein
MTPTAALLASLEAIFHEMTSMLMVLDEAESILPASERREAKRRVLEMRGKTQELLEWLSEARLEEPTN